MSGKIDTLMKGDVLSFATEMKKLVNQKDLSDVKFVIGPNRKSIYAHRCILSARCEVFRAMFAEQAKTGSKEEVPFVLSDITPEIFMAVLEFIYTNCVTLNPKIAVDVLGLSLEYGLDDLRRVCVDYLIETLHKENACEAMQAAVIYKQEELKDEALRVIEENAQDIFNTKGFHELSDDALCVVLESDGLKIDEGGVIEGVREWASVNSVVQKRSMGEVARHVVEWVRLSLLTPEELGKVEGENDNIALFPVDLISFAWKVHALKKTDPKNHLTRRRAGTNSRDCHKAMGL